MCLPLLVLLLDLPESSAPPSPSTTQAASSADTPTSQSTTTNGASSGTAAATGDAESTSGSKKSNAGAVAGGVIGGLTGFVLVGLAIFVIRLRSRRNAATGGTLEHTTYNVDAQSWEKSPVTSVSTHKLYVRSSPSLPRGRSFILSASVLTTPMYVRTQDPNDPRTFPAQDPYARIPLQVSTGYLASDSSAGVLGSNFDGHRGGGGNAQNPYRGAPEL